MNYFKRSPRNQKFYEINLPEPMGGTQNLLARSWVSRPRGKFFLWRFLGDSAYTETRKFLYRSYIDFILGFSSDG